MIIALLPPPYWSMLKNYGSEGQRARRRRGLQLVYSDKADDLGNIDDYEEFETELVKIYNQVASLLKPGKVLTVILKNVKRNHIVYPLAWDLVFRLCANTGQYKLIGSTLWCQDNVPLKPFAVGTHWVSNILHQYCLHFEKI